MRKERFSFQNRHDLKIVGEVWHPENVKGLAFVHHGLSGYIAQPHIQLMADILLSNSYCTVLFDSTHSFGESDGLLEHATWTTHKDDLEDVIAWAEKQSFYQEPFLLAGHSMGGFSTLHFTVNNPKKVIALAPTSACISGKLKVETNTSEENALWKSKGFREKIPRHKPDLVGRVSWQWMEDAQQYDLLEACAAITCPVFLAVGSDDDGTPPRHQKLLMDKVSGPKELHVIPDCGHTFRTPEELNILGATFDKWLREVVR